jgi:hypothetical protein
MTHRATSFLFLVLSILISCGSQDQLEKRLLGKWRMEKVYEYGQDVTAKHNPVGNRYFQFNPNGTFMSEGDPFGKNTGKWKVDNEKSILFIDSDIENDDSEWNVSFKDDETIWTGIGHPRKENTKLVHRKVLRD